MWILLPVLLHTAKKFSTTRAVLSFATFGASGHVVRDSCVILGVNSRDGFVSVELNANGEGTMVTKRFFFATKRSECIRRDYRKGSNRKYLNEANFFPPGHNNARPLVGG